MMRADLHMHSTFSDGSDTPAELAEKAARKGLQAIAITDHDTLAHFQALPEHPRVRVLGGIEISAVDPQSGIKAHILGYGIQNPAPVEALVAPLRARRHANSLRQIGLLQDHGYYIDVDRLQKADGRYIYKQHILQYLVRTHQADELFGTFYRRVFKGGGFCDFDIAYVDARDAVAAIHQAGGLAVLAHPGQQKNFHLILSLPLDGVEYRHVENRPEDRETIMECVQDRTTPLFLTGGSDYHGMYNDRAVEIGDYLACESGVDQLC